MLTIWKAAMSLLILTRLVYPAKGQNRLQHSMTGGFSANQHSQRQTFLDVGLRCYSKDFNLTTTKKINSKTFINA
jgi:hypothetical protein